MANRGVGEISYQRIFRSERWQKINPDGGLAGLSFLRQHFFETGQYHALKANYDILAKLVTAAIKEGEFSLAANMSSLAVQKRLVKFLEQNHREFFLLKFEDETFSWDVKDMLVRVPEIKHRLKQLANGQKGKRRADDIELIKEGRLLELFAQLEPDGELSACTSFGVGRPHRVIWNNGKKYWEVELLSIHSTLGVLPAAQDSVWFKQEVRRMKSGDKFLIPACFCFDYSCEAIDGDDEQQLMLKSKSEIRVRHTRNTSTEQYEQEDEVDPELPRYGAGRFVRASHVTSAPEHGPAGVHSHAGGAVHPLHTSPADPQRDEAHHVPRYGAGSFGRASHATSAPEHRPESMHSERYLHTSRIDHHQASQQDEVHYDPELPQYREGFHGSATEERSGDQVERQEQSRHKHRRLQLSDDDDGEYGNSNAHHEAEKEKTQRPLKKLRKVKDLLHPRRVDVLHDLTNITDASDMTLRQKEKLALELLAVENVDAMYKSLRKFMAAKNKVRRTFPTQKKSKEELLDMLVNWSLKNNQGVCREE